MGGGWGPAPVGRWCGGVVGGGKVLGGGEAEAGRSPPARKGKGEESSRLRAAAAAAVPLGEIPRAARGLWDRRPGLGRALRCPVPRGPVGRRGGWRLRIRSAVGLAALPQAAAAAVRPWPPPLPVPRPCVRGPSRGPAPAPRWRSRPPFCPVGAARAEAESRAGLRPGDACPGGGPRDAAASPAAARFPPGCGRAALRAPSPRCRGGGVVLRGGFRWLEACRAVRRARPGAAAGARGTWDVWGGRPGVSRGGKRAGGRGRPPRLDPPHARARFSPRSPAPRRSPRFPLRGSSRGGASRAPALPKPPFLRPLRLPTPAGLPPVPPARAPACPPAVPPAVPRAHPYLPRPPSPSRLSPLPRALASLSLPPSRRVWRRGGCWCVAGRGGSSVVGGWRLGRCVWGFASLGVGRRTGRVAERGLFPGPAFRSSRRPSALASRGSSWRARASLRDATSDQTWRPAEFKHISQRRKRN